MAESLPPISEVPPDYEPEAESPSPPARGVPRWLVLGVVLLGVFTGWLAWRTSQLESENTALQGQVTSLQQQVQAYRTHLDGARERAADLRTRVDDLESYLAQDPQ